MFFEQKDIWSEEEEAIYGTITNKINIFKIGIKEQMRRQSKNELEKRIMENMPFTKPIAEIRIREIKGRDYEL